MKFVGDVHGKFGQLQQLLDNSQEEVIQLGDLGIGFRKAKSRSNFLTNFKYDPSKFKFIRGNHDNPEKCIGHQNYLGDYGLYKDIFYVSGAWSIDQNWRINGIDWWPKEELSMIELMKMISMYEKIKPNVVISHDCPLEVTEKLYHEAIPTQTGRAFDEMLAIHRPQIWVFGHHHCSKRFVHQGTSFIALDELQVVQLDNCRLVG